MSYWIGGLAALVCFALNRALFLRVGYRTVTTYSPVLEEACKTFPAYVLGAAIWPVHVVFGAIEGAYDFYTNQKSGAAAALLSVLGHTLFGAATVAVLALADSIAAAMVAGSVLHVAWNLAMVRFFP